MMQQQLILQQLGTLLIAGLVFLSDTCDGIEITDDNSTSSDNGESYRTQSPSESTEELYKESPESIWGGIDILVAVFFIVAAVWLFLAIVYSTILLILLRLQSRGRLNPDDENFGRLMCCNGRLSLYLGCLIHWFASRLAVPRNTNEQEFRRIMTRQERRTAIESLLASSPEANIVCTILKGKAEEDEEDEGEQLCSICLAGYEHNNHVFSSKKCQHCFHKECILKWLERRDNTECPVCRENIVSSENVWRYVKKMRKEQRAFFRPPQMLSRCFRSNEERSTQIDEEVSSPSLTDEEENGSDLEQGGVVLNVEDAPRSSMPPEDIALDVESPSFNNEVQVTNRAEEDLVARNVAKTESLGSLNHDKGISSKFPSLSSKDKDGMEGSVEQERFGSPSFSLLHVEGRADDFKQESKENSSALHQREKQKCKECQGMQWPNDAGKTMSGNSTPLGSTGESSTTSS